MTKKDFTSQADILLGKAKAPGTNNNKGKETTATNNKIELTTRELRDKKVLVAMTQTLFDKISKQAKMNKLSFNETINQLLDLSLKQ
jgi:hypothetical protein